MIVRGPLANASISVSPTRIRQTPPTSGERFGEILRAGGEALLASAQEALRIIPGGEVLCAAVREGSNAARRSGSSPRTAGAASPESPAAEGEADNDIWELTQQSQEFNLMYLQLQEELSRENRRFAALSNVLKTRHETARSVISNI